jgi:DNA polymerase III subunit beta
MMKFKAKKEVLIKGIDIIQNIISTKATLPILSNILLDVQQNSLCMTSTDLNIGITCVIPVNTLEQGGITVPAKRFSSIVRELSGEDVEVSTKKNNMVTIETSLCQFKIIGLPGDEFPKLPEFKDKEVIKLDQATLKAMLNLTSFAVSMDETRYILNGILFKINKSSIILVATDGKRLAIAERALPQNSNKDIQIIVPLKTIQELIRNLGDDGELSLVVGANQLLFDFGKVVIISRLIEGEFPDYQQVIPPVSDSRFTIGREAFLSAVKRASLLSTQDYQAVKLEVLKDKVMISKSTPDIGESREELGIKYQGKEMAIGFNPVYLIDVLKNLPYEEVEFEISGSEKPGVIRTEGYIYIVLPMRIG